MPFLKTLMKLTAKLDLFYSNQILRYSQDTQYKTFSGGIVSAVIIGVIMFSFSGMIIGTMQRTTIESKFQLIKQPDPTLYEIIPGQQTMFMFGISISSLDLDYIADLVNEPKIFNVSMTVLTYIDGIVASDVKTPLEQCTKEHWKMMPSLIQDESFESYGVSSWLCPQIGAVLPIKGHYTSKQNTHVKIEIYECSNQTSNSTCATEDEIDEVFKKYSNFLLTYYYISPVINPSKPDHLSYSLEGDDYTIFSRQVGCEATVFVSDYTIKTDNSIIPLSDIKQQTGYIILEKSEKNIYKITENTPLSYFYFSKSKSSLTYERQVLKISTVISYIGGLIGAVTAFLFLVKAYTDCSLEINTGLKLFHKNLQSDQHQNFPKNFSVLNFIKLNIYSAFQKVGIITEPWEDCKLFEDYQYEIVRQLDIKLILKRLIMMQTCMTYVFDEDQLEGIKNQAQISREKAKQLREQFVKSVHSIKQTTEGKTHTQSSLAAVDVKNNIVVDTNMSEIKKSQECYTANHLHKGQNKGVPKMFACIHVQDITDMQFEEVKKSEEPKQTPSEPNILQHVDIQSLQQLRSDAETNQISYKIWSNLNQKIKTAIQSLPSSKKHKKRIL